ncbi:MAG: DUF2203 domain-containing protein [Phycisphaerae bacterium]|jgi:hypothetical protein
MSDSRASTVERRGARPPRRFTVESANQSLVFVRRVVRDVVEHYRDMVGLRARRAELAMTESQSAAIEQLSERIAAHVEQLDELADELSHVGCELKDWDTGLVDFAAMLDGRRICLCWRLGEEQITHWHEVDAGFAGRQPIDEHVRQRIREQASA